MACPGLPPIGECMLFQPNRLEGLLYIAAMFSVVAEVAHTIVAMSYVVCFNIRGCCPV